MAYEFGRRWRKESEIPCVIEHIDDEEEQKRRSRGRRLCGCGVWFLLAASVACLVGSFMMMATNFFSVFIQENLTLKERGFRFDTWKRPPVQALFRVYLFNYTNIAEYESGREPKLRVEEVGPYTYIETLERVDVRHNPNGTLTYRDKKTYRFSPELSNGSEDDRLTVPNIPYMGAIALANEKSFFVRLALKTGLSAIKAGPFISLTAHEYLWGYNDNLGTLTAHHLKIQYKADVDKFGLFAMKNRTQEDTVTIYTGEENALRTGIITQYGDKSELDYWETKECNRIDGTDGTIYPPGLVQPNSTLYLYVKDMCRRLPLEYESSKVDQHGINVYRYRLARDVFASGRVKDENRCFCNHGPGNNLDCMPSGVFNVSPCAFGGPVVISLPHFLYGDPMLLENFEGLSPEPKIHESFVEIDPRLGLPLSGKSRFQFNVQMRRLGYKLYPDKLIVPVSWMDYGVDRLPDDISTKVGTLIYFIDLTEIGFLCLFVAAVVVLCGLLLRLAWTAWRQQREAGLFGKNLELSTVDMPLVACHGKA